MRSTMALESRRAQASASSIITSATVLVPIICASGSVFNNWGGTASCFLLAGISVGEGSKRVLGKEGIWASCTSTYSFPPTSIPWFPFNLFSLSEAALNELPSSPSVWTNLSIWRPAGLKMKQTEENKHSDRLLQEFYAMRQGSWYMAWDSIWWLVRFNCSAEKLWVALRKKEVDYLSTAFFKAWTLSSKPG